MELQERLADMATRSVQYNNLEDKLQLCEADVKGIATELGSEKYDVVTCNPPYFPAHEASEKNLKEHLAIARHEIHLTLDEAVQSASELLKQGGKAAFVHRPGRLLRYRHCNESESFRTKTNSLRLSKRRKRSKYIINRRNKGWKA